MNDNVPSTGAKDWANHFNSVAEFHRHRKALDLTDAELTQGENRLTRLFGIILFSTIMGSLLMGVISAAYSLSP